jgi:hypothetical protein
VIVTGLVGDRLRSASLIGDRRHLYAYVHGRVYAATDPLGLEGLETMADGMLHQAMNAGQQAAANEFSRGVLETTAKAVAGGAICTQYAPLCVGAAAVRLATEGYDHDAAGKVLAEEAPTLAGARFTTRGKLGTSSQASVEKELVASAAPVAPLGEAARGGASALRATYVSTAEELGAVAGRLKAGGMSAEEVVRTMSPLRNELKLNIREQGPWILSKAADLRNVIVYGNRAGPSPEQLLLRYGTWEKALDAISRTNTTLNRVTGVAP